MAKPTGRPHLPGGSKRLWKRRIKIIRHNLAAEFNLYGWPPSPTQIVTRLHRLSQSTIVILGTYVLLRFLLLKKVLSDKSVDEAIVQMNEQLWFDMILLVLLIGFILTTIIRLFVAIRFSTKVMWICVFAFGLYLIEVYWLKDFEFLCSRLVPGHPHYLFLLMIPPVAELLLRIYHALRKKRMFNHSLFVENQPPRNKKAEASTRDALVDLIGVHLNKAYFERSYSIGLVGNWGVGKTTFMDALQLKLSDCVIIEFNPWLSTGKHSLLQEFHRIVKGKSQWI